MESPLKRLYKIEKTIFPETPITEQTIDKFEEVLIKLYSDLNKEKQNSNE